MRSYLAIIVLIVSALGHAPKKLKINLEKLNFNEEKKYKTPRENNKLYWSQEL